jgi:hypothetical protein
LQRIGGMQRMPVAFRIIRWGWIAGVSLIVGQAFAACAVNVRDLCYTRRAADRVQFLTGRGYFMWSDNMVIEVRPGVYERRPGRVCPPDTAALARATGQRAAPDPWGTPYQLHCVEGTDGRVQAWPRVFSAGPDRTPGTLDDVD